MPVDKIGIEEYKHFLSTCRIQETSEVADLPAIRSRFDRNSQLKSLDMSPTLIEPESRARRSKFGTTEQDFFARRSMHKDDKDVNDSALKSIEASSPGLGSQFTSYGGSQWQQAPSQSFHLDSPGVKHAMKRVEFLNRSHRRQMRDRFPTFEK